MFVTEDKEVPFGKYSVIYADPNMKHQFRNVGETTLRFLCIIPHPDKVNKGNKPKSMNPFAGGVANNC
jgi:mannose-6-phosphate isomerase-like protein (cupin superfamily)